MSQIEIQRILSEIRRINGTLSETALQKPEAGAAGFGEILTGSIDKVNRTQLQAQQLSQRFESGDPSINLAEVMINLQKANIAFTAMSQVRNRFVEAYREIMGMQV